MVWVQVFLALGRCEEAETELLAAVTNPLCPKDVCLEALGGLVKQQKCDEILG